MEKKETPRKQSSTLLSFESISIFSYTTLISNGAMLDRLHGYALVAYKHCYSIGRYVKLCIRRAISLIANANKGRVCDEICPHEIIISALNFSTNLYLT